MSESERFAFQVALQGPVAWADDGAPIIGGCKGWANEQLPELVSDEDGFSQSAADLWNSDEFAPLRTAFDQRFLNSGTLPERVALQNYWASCMADAGFANLSHRDDVWAFSQANADAFAAAWVENWQTGEMRAGWELAVVEARQSDVDLALADLDCAESTNFNRRYNAVTFAIDQQFLTDHAADFAALRAAAEQGR